MVVEVQLEEIKPLSPLPADFFDPPAGSTVWGDCTAGEMWKVKDKVQPEYPHSARVNGIAGTVTFGAVIGDDGRVSNLRVMRSAGTELDRAAANAVSRWRYERTTACQGSSGRSETAIDVIFSLRF
jgi:TonB family protein